MAKSLNQVNLIGYLGKPPDFKENEGKPFAVISLALNEEWVDKQTKEKKKNTDWVTVVFFDQLAKIANDYLKKGSHIHVSGKIRTRKWQDKNKKDRYSTEVVAHDLMMLDKIDSNDNKENLQDNSESGAIENQ